jgi:hypothetical protein
MQRGKPHSPKQQGGKIAGISVPFISKKKDQELGKHDQTAYIATRGRLPVQGRVKIGSTEKGQIRSGQK